MLSEDALKLMGNLDRAQTERRVRRIYDLWARGDIDSMIDNLSADVKLATTGQWRGSGRPVEGRSAAEARLREANACVENILSVLHEVVIDGDRAVVHRTAIGRWRENGRRYQCDFVDIFRFRDALVTEFAQYPDAAWVEEMADA